MTTEAVSSRGLEWKLIVFGVAAGTVLCLSLHQMTAQTFNNSFIPTFMSLLGFVVMGIVIGYKSKGYTLIEPAIGGAITIVLTGFILSAGFGYPFSIGEMFGGALVGLALGLVGGWVGEEIQKTEREKKQKVEKVKGGKLLWGWILAGTVLAYTLNAFFVVGGFVLLKFPAGGILAAFGASFLIAGIMIGYLSPGITITEAAISGVLSVLLNSVVLYLFSSLLHASDYTYVLAGMAIGFVLSLAGGWLGEKLQAIMERTSADEEE